MPLHRTMRSGDVMRVGNARVKFRFGEGKRGREGRAIMLVDYGDDGEIDEIEVSVEDWFDLASREYVPRDAVQPEMVAFGVRDKCFRISAVISFAAPAEVVIYPEAF